MARHPLIAALIGEPCPLPRELLDMYPELRSVRWRRGGVATRIGGWCLGRRSVAAITLWNVVFLGPGIRPSPELLLHELAHVRQFAERPTFPLVYLWESVRRGYHDNRFEVEARTYAAGRVQRASMNEAQAVPRA